MVSKFTAFLVLYIFTLFFLSIGLVPLVFIASIIRFGFFTHETGPIPVILLSIITACLVLSICYIAQISHFYSKNFLKSRLNGLIPMKNTKYDKVVSIVLEDLENSLQIPPNWLQIYCINTTASKKIYSFGSAKEGIIAITNGMMKDLLVHIQKDAERALEEIKALFTHEISHLAHYDYIVYYFFKSNSKILSVNRDLFRYPLIGSNKVLKIIPISFLRRLIDLIFYPLKKVSYIFWELGVVCFGKIYSLLRKTLCCFGESRADRDVILVVGEDGFSFMLESVPLYSTAFSMHSGSEKRMSYIKNIEKSDGKIKFKEDFRDANLIFYSTFIAFSIIFASISLYLLQMQKINYF